MRPHRRGGASVWRRCWWRAQMRQWRTLLGGRRCTQPRQAGPRTACGPFSSEGRPWTRRLRRGRPLSPPLAAALCAVRMAVALFTRLPRPLLPAHTPPLQDGATPLHVAAAAGQAACATALLEAGAARDVADAVRPFRTPAPRERARVAVAVAHARTQCCLFVCVALSDPAPVALVPFFGRRGARLLSFPTSPSLSGRL